jgi:diguanylate cyclase (GGDEF)-like protein
MSSQQTDKGKILIAEPSATARQAVSDALKNDFTILMAENGLQVLDIVAKTPDLVCIMMDLAMPELDGFKTTEILKSNFITYHIPIIIVTDKVSLEDMAMAITMGADDYVKKPVDLLELKARLIMNLHRTERDQNTNPLTRLPGNALINRTIVNRLMQPLAVLYLDLDNFKSYNDKYGFSMGDQLLKYTANTIAKALKTAGNPTDFLGHIGGDDFIAISTPDKAAELAQNICTTFDQSVGDFYNEEDRKQKKIVAHDRQGNVREFPLCALSIAIISNEKRVLTSTLQIAQIAAELKHYAKTKPNGALGSNYVKDRRSS